MSRLTRWLMAALTLAGGLVSLPARPAQAQAPATLYVDVAGDDGNDCQSPASACRTLGAALARAAAGATIAVAAGRYPELLTIRSGVSIIGAGAADTLIDGAGGGPVVTSYASEAPVILRGLTITGGRAVGAGGGIANYGQMQIVDSIVRDNSVSPGEGFQGLGGGIFSFGDLTISGSAVVGNRGASGGGVNSRGALRLINSTVGDNSASLAGGGLLAAPGTAELTHVTLSGNSAGAGGGIAVEGGGGVTIGNSIVAGNSAADGPDCSATLASLGGNLLGQSAGCDLAGASAGDLRDRDPLLEPLADNGGPSPSFALASGSPAIDAALDARCAPADQRGVARPQGLRCDSGAYEREASTLYVAPAGDDAGDCRDPAAPCASFARALALAAPGDTISAAAGRYAERLALKADIILAGAGAEQTTLDAGGAGPTISVAAAARALVRGLTISGGADPAGGGVQNYGQLALEASIVRDNRVDYTPEHSSAGGGVANYGTMTISATAVLSNSGVFGGGVANSGQMTITNSLIDSNSGLFGGGLYNLRALRVVSSTLSGNLAVLGGGGFNLGDATLAQTRVLSNSALLGAGVMSFGVLTADTSLFYANSADESGGAIYSGDGGELALSHTTITGNRAARTGGVSSVIGARSRAFGSIIAGNSGAQADCDQLTSLGRNLLGAGAGCAFVAGPGDLIDIDPRLGPAAGVALPVAPLADSPAVDQAGACAGADLRGVARPQGASCDIGAYERRAPEAAARPIIYRQPRDW